LFVQKIESRLTVAKILTADQMEKLKEHGMRQKNRNRHGEKKYGQYKEKGHGRMLSDSGDCIYNAKN
jgi:hypothetical protein